jgi:hypothetical protein
LPPSPASSFENDQFWATRSEILEKQPAAVASAKRKRSTRGAAPDSLRHDNLDYAQPHSILNRAVGGMFAFAASCSYFSSMSIPDAMLRFAMSRVEVVAVVDKATADSASEGHRAALAHRHRRCS